MQRPIPDAGVPVFGRRGRLKSRLRRKMQDVLKKPNMNNNRILTCNQQA